MEYVQILYISFGIAILLKLITEADKTSNTSYTDK